jgi:hypothetical protein
MLIKHSFTIKMIRTHSKYACSPMAVFYSIASLRLSASVYIIQKEFLLWIR